MQFLYKFLSKKLGISEEELKKKVEEKIKEFEGLITEEGALALVAKEYGLDITDLILGKRFTISMLTSGMRNIYVTVKLYKKIFEKDFVICYKVFDETGTAYAFFWKDAKEKIKEFGEGSILRLKIDKVKEGKRGLELHIFNPNNIQEEKNEKIKELLLSIERPEKEIIEFTGIPLKEEENYYYIFNLKGNVIKAIAENLELGKVYYFRGVKERDIIKIINAEKINVEERIRKLLS